MYVCVGGGGEVTVCAYALCTRVCDVYVILHVHGSSHYTPGSIQSVFPSMLYTNIQVVRLILWFCPW